MSGVYLCLALVCLFFFYHHPMHIGVVVQKRIDDDGFFVDSLGTNFALSATAVNRTKRQATLFDIFKHQEITMFILCLTLKKMHEFSFFRQITISNDYTYYQNNYPAYYNMGALLGILAFGFLSDNVLQHKMYTTIAFVTLA